MQNRVIVFFDGACVLCNRFVDEILVRDPEHLFQFAALQGDTARQLISPEKRQSLNSVLVLNQGRILEKSAAVLFILSRLPGLRWIRFLSLIPGFARDPIYDFVARHRLSWFGQREHCRLPTADEKDRILP